MSFVSTKRRIPVGMYVFRWPPLDVSTIERFGPQVNKFEQVSSDDHQMSVVGGGEMLGTQVLGPGGRYPGPISGGGGMGGRYLSPMSVEGAMGGRLGEEGEGVSTHIKGEGRGYPCPNASWVMVTLDRLPSPLNRMTDRHLWKHYFLATSFTGGNKYSGASGKMGISLNMCQIDDLRWRGSKVTHFSRQPPSFSLTLGPWH